MVATNFNNDEPVLVLASQSPRRLELLNLIGISFQVVPSSSEEIFTEIEPGLIVKQICKAKVFDVANKLINSGKYVKSNLVILAADTVVVVDQKILGKPESKEHAFEMLMSLSNKVHEVYTGVSVAKLNYNYHKQDFAISKVFFRKLDPIEIKSYINTNEPFDKAGAYALQGIASCFVEKIEGCYTNVIGLPMPLTINMLRDSGIQILGLPR
jgi:septum formation protein